MVATLELACRVAPLSRAMVWLRLFETLDEEPVELAGARLRVRWVPVAQLFGDGP